MNSRELAERIFQYAVKSVQPEFLIGEHISINGQTLRIAGKNIRLPEVARIFIVGAGKATASMAAGVEKILGTRISSGLIVVKYGHTVPLSHIMITEAGHPIPDASGFKATAEILKIVNSAGASDLIISLLSGGGSALLADSPEGITHDELAEMNSLLVRSGADINEINIVRKHVSNVKGGRLAAAAYPATLINLILSDVPGDSPETIASGPACPDSSTFRQAMDVITRHDIVYKVPGSILRHLADGINGLLPESPKPGDPVFGKVTNFLIGTNSTALKAAADEANNSGFKSVFIEENMAGDVMDVADRIIVKSRQVKHDNSVLKPALLIFGGETTIQVTGQGLGGRNQHLALLCAARLEGEKDITILSAGTDGNDGPTDAAGAVVDHHTIKNASRLKIDPYRFLSEFDSYNFFRQAGGHIITGPTLTNVMDIVLAVVE
jgi:glycerate 2-kinase